MLQETIVQDAVLQEVKPAQQPPTNTLPRTCPNCEEIKTGRFCAHCGAEDIDPHELSVSHFLHHLWHELTHLDNAKLPRTLHYLLLRPGKLTLEYFAGRKLRYISPIRLFLILFALSYFIYSAFETTDMFNLELLMQMDRQGQLSQLLQDKIARAGLTFGLAADQVSEKWQQYHSMSQLAYLLLMSLTLKVFFWRRYLVEHTVFSLHFMAFSLVLSMLVWPVFNYTGLTDREIILNLSGIFYLITSGYLVVAIRRVYKQTWTTSLLKSLGILACYYLIATLVYFLTFLMAWNQVVKG